MISASITHSTKKTVNTERTVDSSMPLQRTDLDLNYF